VHSSRAEQRLGQSFPPHHLAAYSPATRDAACSKCTEDGRSIKALHDATAGLLEGMFHEECCIGGSNDAAAVRMIADYLPEPLIMCGGADEDDTGQGAETMMAKDCQY
jgi:hypothetical protein